MPKDPDYKPPTPPHVIRYQAMARKYSAPVYSRCAECGANCRSGGRARAAGFLQRKLQDAHPAQE